MTSRTQTLLVLLGTSLVLLVLSRTQKGAAVVANVTDSIAATVRGIRNQNPGNLRANQFRGFIGVDDGGYAVYDTMANGVRASARQLKLYFQRGTNTVRKIVSTWAPSTENDTERYIANLVQWTGYGPDSVLPSTDAVRFALLRGIFRKELGPVPAATITDAMIREGIASS